MTPDTMLKEHPESAGSATSKKELITSRFMSLDPFHASSMERLPTVAPILRAGKRACYRHGARSLYPVAGKSRTEKPEEHELL